MPTRPKTIALLKEKLKEIEVIIEELEKEEKIKLTEDNKAD